VQEEKEAQALGQRREEEVQEKEEEVAPESAVAGAK
jgi:hypothetical protein